MLAGFPAGLVDLLAWNNALSVLQQSFIMRRNCVKVGIVRQSQGDVRSKKVESKTLTMPSSESALGARLERMSPRSWFEDGAEEAPPSHMRTRKPRMTTDIDAKLIEQAKTFAGHCILLGLASDRNAAADAGMEVHLPAAPMSANQSLTTR